jgi:hypothetical protein
MAEKFAPNDRPEEGSRSARLRAPRRVGLPPPDPCPVAFFGAGIFLCRIFLSRLPVGRPGSREIDKLFDDPEFGPIGFCDLSPVRTGLEWFP